MGFQTSHKRNGFGGICGCVWVPDCSMRASPEFCCSVSFSGQPQWHHMVMTITLYEGNGEGKGEETKRELLWSVLCRHMGFPCLHTLQEWFHLKGSWRWSSCHSVKGIISVTGATASFPLQRWGRREMLCELRSIRSIRFSDSLVETGSATSNSSQAPHHSLLGTRVDAEDWKPTQYCQSVAC